MNQIQTIVDVAVIVRDFLQNEGATLSLSKGKLKAESEKLPRPANQLHIK